jgi:MFS family permease
LRTHGSTITRSSPTAPTGTRKAERFRRRDHAAINALWIGVQFQEAALLSILVPAIVLRLAPEKHTFVLAWLSTAAAVAAALVPPFVGALSDRLRRLGGDRRMQTAVLLVLDAVALLLMSRAGTIWAIAAALIVSVGAMNGAATIYQVLVPEIVPRAAWGTAAGFRGAMTLFGTIAGLAVAALLAPPPALLITAALIALSALTLRAIPRTNGAPPNAHAVIRDRRDLGITLVARAWIVLGISLLNTYILYFFTDVLGVHDASLGTGLVAGAALIGAIASSVAAGMLSDQMDRRAVVALSGVPMIVAALGFALAPDPRFIFVYAAAFGLGYGGVFSVGWAIALDAIPELGDAARDLGVWGTLSNLPAVVAPMIGAAIIAHGATPRDGFRWLFVAAGLSFALSSLTVLRVGTRPLGSPLGILLLTLIYLARAPYRIAKLRVRQWGRLPFRRGPTILIANHQQEDESEVVVLRALAGGPWKAPIFTASSRRMFERGFIAARIPWTAPVTRSLNLGSFFRTIGLNPLENQLSSRPLASLALEVRRAHGDLPLEDVFRPDVLASLESGVRRLSDVEQPAHFDAGQQLTKLSAMRDPYRREAMAALRAGVESDIAHIVDLVRRGATFFVTPEGFYSTDGRLQPLKGIVERLVGLGEIWFAAIAFDPFRGRRLSMLYRVVRPAAPADLATSLAAARPVTTSALVAGALARLPASFSAADLVRTASDLRNGLPALLFVDPEFDADRARAVGEALRTLLAHGTLVADGTGYVRAGPYRDPHFPDVADLLSFQAVFFGETVDAASRLATATRR